MRTIISMMMAILMLFASTQAVAQEVNNTLVFRDCPKNTGNELSCMACVIYYEARGESRQGRVAVGAVVMNRMESSRFPGSVCGVVFQRGQFSWIRPGVRNGVKLNQAAWNDSVQLARQILSRQYSDPSNGALYFHHRSVAPSLGKARRTTAVIGQHIFKR